MADVKKNIILSFQVEGTGLDDTITGLEKAGKLGTDAANSIRTGFQKIDAETKEGAQSIDALKKKFQEMIKLGGQDVKLGIADELVRLGFTAEDATEFIQQLGTETEKTGKKVVSSKQQLKAMREELIQLSIQGKTNTDRFRQLSAEAGHLEDTIGDVTKTVKHLGSDTHVFDGLIGAASGVAGAFSVAQGAAGLFGSENEELQAALLKVNSAMAILQGLQAIQNTLQKDSAASLLFLREAKTADVVATEGQIVATTAQTIATNIAAAAQKALSVIMALSNPITLAVVAAIVAVTAIYKIFTADAKAAAEAQEAFNLRLEEGNKLEDQFQEGFAKQRATHAKELKAQGFDERTIREKNIKDINFALKEAEAFRLANATEGEKARLKLASESGAEQDADEVKRLEKTVEEYDKAVKRKEDLEGELNDAILDDRIALNAELAKIDADRAAKEAKAIQDAEDARRRALTERIAVLKLASAQTNEDSFAQKRIKEQIILSTAALDKFEIGLKVIHGEITAIQGQAEKGLIDIKAADDIKEVNKQIVQNIDQTNEQILDAAHKRVDGLQQTNLKVLDGHIDLNNKILISDKDLAAKQALVDEARRKKRREELAKVTGIIAGQLSAAAQSLGTFFDQQAQQQLDGIERQKDAVKELQNAGEITEKEAIIRNRRLDQQAKKIQTEQAKRQKAIAIFEAIVNGAAAVTKALAEGGPLLAIAVGVIAAAQIALIASKPIPKFRAGKPIGGYEGPGLIGEAGPEIHQTGQRMILATEPTVTYLRRNDRVFNARETAELISAAPQMNRQYQVYSHNAPHGASMDIDYKRFGQEVGSHVHNTAVNLTEKGLYTLSKKNGDFYKYLNARRGL